MRLWIHFEIKATSELCSQSGSLAGALLLIQVIRRQPQPLACQRRWRLTQHDAIRECAAFLHQFALPAEQPVASAQLQAFQDIRREQ